MKTLIVDENDVSRAQLVSLLKGYGDCETAADAARAFDMYIQAGFGSSYDLLVVDIDPPGNGQAFVRKVQQCADEQRGKVSPVPILMITAKADVKCVAPFCHIGREGYCVKPVSTDPLRWALAGIGVIR